MDLVKPWANGLDYMLQSQCGYGPSQKKKTLSSLSLLAASKSISRGAHIRDLRWRVLKPQTSQVEWTVCGDVFVGELMMSVS